MRRVFLLPLVAVLQNVNGQAISDPAWPGGAFPPLPASWRTWKLRDSVSGVFMGNTSGMNSAEETSHEASLGVIGLGWQLGVHSGAAWASPGGLEMRQREAARLLKAAAGKAGKAVRVMVSAELDATCPQWNTTATLLRNRTLSRQVFMTRPNGSLWLDNQWGGLFEQPWYTFVYVCACMHVCIYMCIRR